MFASGVTGPLVFDVEMISEGLRSMAVGALPGVIEPDEATADPILTNQ